MGSIADWAAVFVASAAVVVAVISLLVSRATTNRTLEHSHQLAMIDAKRRAYTEALAHWSGFVAPKKGIAVLQGLERGTVVNSGLSLVAAPEPILRLAASANEVNLHVVTGTAYRSAAVRDLAEVVKLVRDCMIQDLDKGRIDPDLARDALELAAKHSPGAYSDHLKSEAIQSDARRDGNESHSGT